MFKFEPGELQAFERGKRLGSPSHWRGYFAFDVPSYAIRDADVSAFRKATQSDPKAAIRILTRLIEKVHERPGHFLDLLLDRLLDDPTSTKNNKERSGVVVAFAEVMDDVARHTEVRISGRSEIWDKTRLILRKNPPPDFLAVVKKGKSINWLANILRDQGFAFGLPKGYRSYPENAWLKRDEFDECVRVIVGRFDTLGMRKIFALPAPMDVLFCWSRLGDPDEVKKRFFEATSTDTKFLRALEALRGWANSSSNGVYHPLYAQYVVYFADPESVRERLEQLSIKSGSGPRSAKAKELLGAWEPLPSDASPGQPQGDSNDDLAG